MHGSLCVRFLRIGDLFSVSHRNGTLRHLWTNDSDHRIGCTGFCRPQHEWIDLDFNNTPPASICGIPCNCLRQIHNCFDQLPFISRQTGTTVQQILLTPQAPDGRACLLARRWRRNDHYIIHGFGVDSTRAHCYERTQQGVYKCRQQNFRHHPVHHFLYKDAGRHLARAT